jgi:hypothetical protein
MHSILMGPNDKKDIQIAKNALLPNMGRRHFNIHDAGKPNATRASQQSAVQNQLAGVERFGKFAR